MRSEGSTWSEEGGHLDRRENNLRGFKDFDRTSCVDCIMIQAHMCQLRSTVVPRNPQSQPETPPQEREEYERTYGSWNRTYTASRIVFDGCVVYNITSNGYTLSTY